MTPGLMTHDLTHLKDLKHCLILRSLFALELKLGMVLMLPPLNTQLQGIHPEDNSVVQMQWKDILTQAHKCEQSPPLIKEENILSTLHLHLLSLKSSEEDNGKDIKFLLSNFLLIPGSITFYYYPRVVNTFTFFLPD